MLVVENGKSVELRRVSRAGGKNEERVGGGAGKFVVIIIITAGNWRERIEGNAKIQQIRDFLEVLTCDF